jgi:hypothetical protein
MAIVNYNISYDIKVWDKEKNYADRNNSWELRIFGIPVFKRHCKSKEDITEEVTKTKKTGF